MYTYTYKNSKTCARLFLCNPGRGRWWPEEQACGMGTRKRALLRARRATPSESTPRASRPLPAAVTRHHDSRLAARRDAVASAKTDGLAREHVHVHISSRAAHDRVKAIGNSPHQLHCVCLREIHVCHYGYGRHCCCTHTWRAVTTSGQIVFV